MEPYPFALAQVRKAGETILALREKGFETSAKGGDPRDVVTSVDIAVNTALTEAIRTAFPTHAIYTEEGTQDTTPAEYVWTVDPIDGSSNFARGIPHFAVCLGLLRNGVPVVGAVYNPVTRELFSFERGKGAFLNGNPIHVSKETDLAKSAVFLHAGRKPELWEWGGNAYTSLLAHAHKTSNFGSSALDMCFVAAGRLEANIYGRLTTMDIAGAIGILEEAGGLVVGSDGTRVALSTVPGRVIGANNDQILAHVRACI